MYKQYGLASAVFHALRLDAKQLKTTKIKVEVHGTVQ
jgi:hypothetical protein